MIKRSAKIIHDARVFFFAFILFSFFNQVGLNPIDFGKFLGLKIASAAKMNVTAGVAENPYNKAAAQLEIKENNLNEREAQLKELEQKILSAGNIKSNALLMSLTAAIFILFVLMVFNFYLDIKRKKIVMKNSKILKILTMKLH